MAHVGGNGAAQVFEAVNIPQLRAIHSDAWQVQNTLWSRLEEGLRLADADLQTKLSGCLRENVDYLLEVILLVSHQGAVIRKQGIYNPPFHCLGLRRRRLRSNSDPSRRYLM